MSRRTRIPYLLFSAALATGLTACSASDGSSAPVDYHQDAKALLTRYCTGCHQDGGIAPFALTDYAHAQAQASQIQAAVTSGSMPPWLPADDSLPLNHARKLRPEDREVLLRWTSQGAPEGDPSAPSRIVLPPEDTVAPPRPDIVADIGSTYQPNTKLTDDYRCFVMDPNLTADRYMRANDVHPGNSRVVHHVILFEIPQADAATIRSLDDAEPGPGYTCFGGAGIDSAKMVAVWAPGSVPNRLRDDEGLLLHAGSLLVMQIHYNNRQNDGVGDRTVATLELLDTKPANQILIVPIAHSEGLFIAAGDPNAKQVIAVPIAVAMGKFGVSEIVVSGNFPHMHTLGKRIVTSVNDVALVDIPRWDFHWQQAYQFQTPQTLHTTDTLVVECTYDNSYENQPVVSGQKQMPRDVKWGESTSDEMCVSFLHLRLPS